MDRTSITVDNHTFVVDGTADEVLRRWERAKQANTMLRFVLPDTEMRHFIHPDAVRQIASGGPRQITLAWLDH
ncbi:MAG: hypothetical protein AAGC46_13640 [Solirubrobacteraceae bacterium]|nr:hypothetical protein [Patulibacter sp.]